MDRALIDAWRAAELGEGQQRQLELALRAPDAAREFLRELHFDQALRRVAQAQVERQALAPATRPASARHARALSRRWRLARGGGGLAAAAMLAAALALGILWWRSIPAAPVAQLIVNVASAQLDGRTVDAGDQQGLASGAVVELPARGWATLRFSDGTVVEVFDGSRVTVSLVDGAKHLVLDRGEVRAEVRKQPSGKPLVVATPRSETTVVGTRLVVASGAHERVSVDEGRVRVARRSDRTAIEVAAGEMVEVAATGLLAVKPWPQPAPAPRDEPPMRGLQLWLCADRGVAADAQGRVWQWRDQSPHGEDLAQADPEFQPRLLADAAGHHAALSFDERDDCLLGTAPWPEFHSYTVALTLRATSFGSWSQTVGCGWGIFHFHAMAGGGVFAGVGAPGGGIRFSPEELGGDTMRLGVWQHFVVTYDERAGAGSFYRDGKQLARKAMPLPKPWSTFHLGRLRPPPQEPSGFAGDVTEIMVYDRVLADDELTALERRARERLDGVR